MVCFRANSDHSCLLHTASRADESRDTLIIYVRSLGGKSPEDLHAVLTSFYGKEPFVHVLPFGQMPQTRHVRGSNMTYIGVASDQIKGRAIIGSAVDNLVKGASGQAMQNMNLLLGFAETMGLEQIALFP